MGEQINNFDDIVKIHALSRETLAAIKEGLAQAMGDPTTEKVEFTALQHDAFNREGFWVSQSGSNRHLIVQGATSSGKTLVSEMAIIDSLRNGIGNKKCIVLVPLRAMVRERCEKLRNDFEKLGVQESIYPSSSDYQENDGEIIQGSYTVAVIVYEKFFAMLSSSSTNGDNLQMLKGCSLLIVDELQMLNSHERGPKLEIAIQKVLKRNSLMTDDENTRIMCLTTCDCKVDLIERWLTVDNGTGEGLKPIVIRNTSRPAGLLEHVISVNGEFRWRRTYGDCENISEDSTEGQGKLQGFTAVKGKEHEKKKALLKKLLEKIYAENSDAKVLVFVNSKRHTKNLAQFLAEENLLPLEDMSDEMKRIYNFDVDTYSDALKNLLPRRIAFHNASLSFPLREFIEDLFCDNKHPLKLVLATETLTIGMNMPVDVMILYDSQVRRLSGNEPLTSQEYKNFVGRAGRLGRKNRGFGESYIFADDNHKLNLYWNDYVNYRPEEIKSALAKVGEAGQAPYYVNLLRLFDSKGFSVADLKKLWEESFARKCTDKNLDPQKVCQELTKAKLCIEKNDEDDDEDELEAEKSYRLTDFGKSISPYALSLPTCKIIRSFCKLDYGRKEYKSGLPTDITAEELDSYLLDIIYRICKSEEIKRMTQLKLSRQNNGDSDIYPHIKAAVKKTLRKLIDSGKCKLWEGSGIEKILSPDSPEVYDEEVASYLFRTIVLWYWTKGYTLKEIQQETGFNYKSFTPIVQEDIARVAETVAYVLEAISSCFVSVQEEVFKNLKSTDIYTLSTCVNYGMPRELVVIANKHVRELDRKKILELGKFWDENRHNYNSPAQMLTDTEAQDLDRIRKILDENIHTEIIRKIEESGFHDDYEILLGNMSREGTLKNNEYEAIHKLCKSDLKEKLQTFLEPLKIFFKTCGDEEQKQHFFTNRVELDYIIPKNENVVELICDRKILLATYTDDPDSAEKIMEFIDHKLKRDSTTKVILFCDESNLQRISWDCDNGTLKDKTGKVLFEKINAAMTLKQFAFLLSQTIKNNDTAAQMLTGLLQDIRGKFHCSLNTTGMMLKNFSWSTAKDYTEGSPDLPTLRILLDQRKSAAVNDLTNQLKSAKISYRLLGWGDKLEDENVSGNFYLLFLDWNLVQEMHSLNFFCAKLKRTHYKKTFAIFNSPESFKRWDEGSAHVSFLSHCESTKEFSKFVPEQIKPFLRLTTDNKFLIGVSFAHASEGADLLEAFVDRLNKEFPEDKIFYDHYPTTESLLHGENAGIKNPQYYKECQFFIVLDEEHYDLSEPCKNEFRAIQERVRELDDIEESRIMFLHPSQVKNHFSFFREGVDYATELTKKNLNYYAEMFIRRVKKYLK